MQKYVTRAQILLSWWTLCSIFNNYLYYRNEVPFKFNGSWPVPCTVSSNWHTRPKDGCEDGRILLLWMCACHSRWQHRMSHVCHTNVGLFLWGWWLKYVYNTTLLAHVISICVTVCGWKTGWKTVNVTVKEMLLRCWLWWLLYCGQRDGVRFYFFHSHVLHPIAYKLYQI
jgi:hypothetical protein